MRPEIPFTLIVTLLASPLPVLAQEMTSPSQQQQRQQPQEAPEQQQATAQRQARNTGNDVDVTEEGGLVLELYGNDDEARHVRAGFGGRLETGMGYLYLGHFETVDRGGIRSGSNDLPSSLENRYRSTRLGIYAEGHDRNTGEGFGFGAFLYRNKSDLLLDRYGLGATLDLAYVIANRVRLSAGVDLMPEHLSTDWDADALLEYEWHADLRILVHRYVDIGINWRAGRTNDTGLSTNQYEEATAGFRIAF